MGIAEGVTNVNILEWWVNNGDIPPNWAVACKKIILCQPSSAAVEIFFSNLKIYFNTDQNLALEDYIKLYNIIREIKFWFQLKMSIYFLTVVLCQHYALMLIALKMLKIMPA